MMKLIWKKISEQGWSIVKAQRVFLICSVLIFCVIGAVVWLAVGRLFLKDISWLICFVGYPGFFIGLLGGNIFLWMNEN